MISEIQDLYDKMVNEYGGLSSTSTTKFLPLKGLFVKRLGLNDDDIYITGSGSRPGNLEVRLSQGVQATKHTRLGIGYVIDTKGTEKNRAKLVKSTYVTVRKSMGRGKASYDNILVLIVSNDKVYSEGLITSDPEMEKKLTDLLSIPIIEQINNIDNETQFPVIDIGLPLQVIFYGAPGTGKSYRIDNNQNINEENSIRTTFHPDSDYSTFVGVYKPTMENVPMSAFVGKEVHLAQPQGGHTGKEKRIVYKYVPQAFLKAYVSAWSDLENPHFLIIEEINRGNCAQIFGDLFQLLDRNNMGCSSYAIHADEDITQFLADDEKGFSKLSEVQKDAIRSFLFVKDSGKEEAIGESILSGKKLLLPPNLYIWATMNTSDQSLFPIDSAFKRRWDWEYEPIKYNHDLKIKIGNETYKWISFQKIVNVKIKDATSSEDKMLGDYFVNPRDSVIDENTLRNKILFYLWNDVCKDGEGDIFKVSETEDISFSELYGEDSEKNLIRMMEYLKIEKYVDSTEEEEFIIEEENNEGETKESKHKRFISVTLDGVKYPITTTKFDLYLDIIKKIGIDKVGPLVEGSIYHRQNCPLISKTQYPEIVNKKEYSYIQVGQYYVVKGINDDTKVNILEFLKEQLNLNMDIETGM